MSTLNDLIMSAVSGAEEDEGLASSDLAPEILKVASAIPTRAESDEIEKIAAALEWFGTTGIDAFADLDKRASGASPDIARIQELVNSDHSITQAVALAHPLMSSEDRGQIVSSLSGTAEKSAESKYKGSNDPECSGSTTSGTQADASDADADHHPALASNESAIAFTKQEKSKKTSKSLSRILDAKPYADSTLRKMLDHTGGIDPNIHAKTASDRTAMLEQVKAALAQKLAAKVQGAS